MNKRYLHCLLLICTVGIFLTACDQSSQNVDYQVGENLSVDGPGTLVVPNYGEAGTAEYIVKAFTIEKDYTWTVDGANKAGTKRKGEVVVVSTSDTSAAYTVTVETSVDGEKKTGTASAVATYPSASSQFGTFGLSVFQSAASATGVLSAAAKRGQTVFVPSNAAFWGAFDANDDSTLAAAETPTPGVLAQILKYHVVPGSALRSGDITGGTAATTALGEDVTFVNGNVQGVADTAAVSKEIASSSAALLTIDDVLLPSTAVSINDQTLNRDTASFTPDTTFADTVSVGTFVSDTDGSFLVLHEAANGKIIGNSSELTSGFYGSGAAPYKVAVDSQLTRDTTVVAMPHRDENNNGLFEPGTDGPYTRGMAPVTDTARVEVP